MSGPIDRTYHSPDPHECNLNTQSPPTHSNGKRRNKTKNLASQHPIAEEKNTRLTRGQTIEWSAITLQRSSRMPTSPGTAHALTGQSRVPTACVAAGPLPHTSNPPAPKEGPRKPRGRGEDAMHGQGWADGICRARLSWLFLRDLLIWASDRRYEGRAGGTICMRS